ncbi:MAG: o-succinylbenzoate synthase [Actinobacteria bacterium]|uniref:Unannotated protein n=1 Tax=freshwater metagenome TaxID=449393 RepID=A0A6J7VFH3_9ZZZZ|nr:o-succinylbenzoate synthase [Actinomycetota bacterium]MSY36560.1 o-succinylbenzoate synthase [Actinomycetota bacterium]MTA72990.1 o-succinylbenzoate synthase [Actinomycetota bacterium]MTB29126.1 o-succinylbenzoate synthase [Actinomycetota bacterium]MUH48770.1 o-succinylbenzoate synthase [Actinomycetota bacterium]
MLDSILGSLRVVALATKTDFRSVTSREVALFEGAHGWGEFSPFLEYNYNESVPWLTSAIEAAFVPAPVALRSEIIVNATLPALNNAQEIESLLDSYPGCSVIKVKVGTDAIKDLERLAIIRELRPDAKIRIDVNGLWDVDQATSFLKTAGDIEYVEQPCATVEELRELKKRTDVKIVGDEVIRKAANPFAVDLSGAVDILMLKVAPLGGITRALEIAEHHQLPLVVSSALESAVGISYGLQLASALPSLNFACGLGTGSLLAVDVAHLPIKDGKIELDDVRPESALLNKLAVSNERLNWWKNRIRMTWSAGAERYVNERGWTI